MHPCRTQQKVDYAVTYPWTRTTETLLERIWQEIDDFSTPRGGVAGLVTLATVGTRARPELRQVVLRRADRAAGWVEFFTDATTPKVAEIRANPLVSVLIWNAADKLQIRLRGEAAVRRDDTARPEWQAMSKTQQGNYGTLPAPGTPIAESGAFDRVPDPARLSILRVSLSEIDAVHLARPHDLRAVYGRGADWQGHWVAP